MPALLLRPTVRALRCRFRAARGLPYHAGGGIPPPGGGPPPVSSLIQPKQEVLALYREVLQTARAMTWNDEHGRPWSETVPTRPPLPSSRHQRDYPPHRVGG